MKQFLRVVLKNGDEYLLQLGYNFSLYIIKDDKLYKNCGFLKKELLGEIAGFEL